jgi:hypothetical protein
MRLMQKNLVSKRLKRAPRLFLFSLFLLFASTAMAADPVGKIVALEGEVKGMGADQKERVLKRGGTIFVADTVITGPASRAQLQFTDGSLFNLIPETEFKIDEYSHKMRRQKDRFSAELLKGGFRTLTGGIGKENPDGYEIKTPTSTIGIRGTQFDALIASGAVYFSVAAGQVALTNQTGTYVIGTGTPNQYASIKSIAQKPTYYTKTPDVMKKHSFLEPKGGKHITKTMSLAPAPQPEAPPAPTEEQPQTEESEAAPAEGETTETETSAEAEAAPKEESAPAAEAEPGTPAGGTTGETATSPEFEERFEQQALTPGGGGASISAGC